MCGVQCRAVLHASLLILQYKTLGTHYYSVVPLLLSRQVVVIHEVGMELPKAYFKRVDCSASALLRASPLILKPSVVQNAGHSLICVPLLLSPQVVVFNEIGTEAECAAAARIAQGLFNLWNAASALFCMLPADLYFTSMNDVQNAGH
jgi:hypothetical protein